MSIYEDTLKKTNILIDCIEERFSSVLSDNALPRRPVLIAIDGRCGSGKTTLACELQTELVRRYPKLDIELFHMDDFFPRPEQRTEERLKTPGGNVDHERFSFEVLKNLFDNKAFSYRPFDCASMSLSAPVSASPSHIAIIEGSYSLHPELRSSYDFKVFLDIDPDEQIKRILIRNGREKLTMFIEKWIPLEELYFNACGVRSIADIII